MTEEERRQLREAHEHLQRALDALPHSRVGHWASAKIHQLLQTIQLWLRPEKP